MTPEDVVRRVKEIGLDSSPIIYYVEKNPNFELHCYPFFAAIDSGNLEGYTSAISLTETLVHPKRNADTAKQTTFHNLLLLSRGMTTYLLTPEIAEMAAQLRANYPLRTPDAIQIATAIYCQCDAFLTNDDRLKQVKEIEIVVVSELTPS